MNKKQLFIYDLETYPNMFLAVFKSLDTAQYYYFEISDRKNQITELRTFLKTKVKGLIGFNNLNFDYPVLHNSILKTERVLNSYEIYKEVETIINTKYSSIWENQIKIPQLDLFKIWHYDNKNKSTSLKWLEFAMRLPNVEDLPYKPGTILTFEQMDEIILYCNNDIEATELFFNKSLKHIEIRQFYTKLEGINLLNDSEIGMSKKIFGKYLSKEMGLSFNELKKLRTFRKEIFIKDIIFDYLKFNDPVNQEILDKFKSYKWIDTSHMSKEQRKKHSITFNRKYKNVIREYAEGGLHSFDKAGIYETDDEYLLVDVDFASYYPHLSFRNKLHPEHIPEEVFNKIYEGFYKDRKLYNKKDPRNYVLKIILNGSYGLSKDKYAYLYDPLWQLAICINGQLILTLLSEKIFEKCKKQVKLVFENTDGAMFRIHRSDFSNLQLACDTVAKIVNIPLETQECKKIIIRDVNNYINIISDDNIKFKGCFEIDRDYHKNHSKRIVSIALANYFINNVNVEDTIHNHIKNENILNKYGFCDNYGIYDYCLGAKMMRSNELISREWIKNTCIEKELSKMTRYYVSNNGVELIKRLPPLEKNYLTATDKHKVKFGEGQMNIFDIIEDVKIDPDDREENLEAGFKCTVFNKYIDDNYDLNYDYYINECNKIINVLN